MKKQVTSLVTSTLVVKFGTWFEAEATGWGIVALALVAAAALAASLGVSL